MGSNGLLLVSLSASYVKPEADVVSLQRPELRTVLTTLANPPLNEPHYVFTNFWVWSAR